MDLEKIVHAKSAQLKAVEEGESEKELLRLFGKLILSIVLRQKILSGEAAAGGAG